MSDTDEHIKVRYSPEDKDDDKYEGYYAEHPDHPMREDRHGFWSVPKWLYEAYDCAREIREQADDMEQLMLHRLSEVRKPWTKEAS